MLRNDCELKIMHFWFSCITGYSHQLLQKNKEYVLLLFGTLPSCTK